MPHWLVLLLCFLATVILTVEGARNGRDHLEQDSWNRRAGPQRAERQRRGRSLKPNIVLILTDDQDVLLGSIKAMPKLRELLMREGAYFNNSFTSTPMCCPSRSSTLTGLYVHNHNVYTNNDNCSSPQWQREHESRIFATYLQDAGYKTGYFGKYLNKYNGSYIPPGWTQWVGLIRNSRFYNYTLNYQGSTIKHGDNYYNDYLTDLIANDSVAFFKHSKRTSPDDPVMMMLGLPAPHGPEDAAPQYQHMFVNNTDHRTGSWNKAPNMDKQWLLQQMQPMTPQFKIFTDLLQRRRLQTLQSVDDLIEKVHRELAMIGELDNTYILFTSDHGYHLGQFGLIKGKSLAYDFDVRVPLVVRGPGIKPGSVVNNVAVNIDLAPTMLDMGGVEIPSHMDGVSLLPALKATRDPSRMDKFGFAKTHKPWRDSILLERGKVSKKMIKDRMKQEKLQMMQQSGNQNNLHLYLHPKQQKKARQCSDPHNQLPCKQYQKWYCKVDVTGRQRLHKCRNVDRDPSYNAQTTSIQADDPQFCTCSDGSVGFRATQRSSRRRHRRFLRQRGRRKARGKLVRRRRAAIQSVGDFDEQLQFGYNSGINLLPRRCRILPNNSVSCDQDIYRDYDEWQSHRERIDEMIKEYKKALEDLRDIREHLLEQRPPVEPESEEVEQGGGDDVADDEDCVCENESLILKRPLDREDRAKLRRQQKKLKKQQRMEERGRKKGRRGRKKKNCNGKNMKCFSHDNEHWKTPPYWAFEEEIGGSQAQGCPSLRLFRRLNFPSCSRPGMECTLMDNCHWKTPPYWTNGPFCFCSNANNNTYWCVRTVNQTHNTLYCEYITNFISYYDMNHDPDQLRNIAKSLHFGVLQQLHDQLAALKVCNGRHDCDLHNHHRLHIKPENWNNRHIYQDNSGDGDLYDDEDYNSSNEEVNNVYDTDDVEADEDEDYDPDFQDPDFF